MLLKDARIGELVFDASVGRSLWGIRNLNGIATLVRIPPPYTDWHSALHLALRRGRLRPRRLARRRARLGVRRRRERAAVAAGHEGRDAAQGRRDAGRARSTSATAIPSNFVFSPDGKYLYGSSYYTGVSNIFRYDLATGKLDAMSNTETGFFRPIPLGGDELVVFRYTGQGFVPARIHAKPLEDVNPITFLGAADRREAPDRQGLEARLAGERAARLARDRARRRTARSPSIRLESVYPVVAGLQGLRGRRPARELLRPGDAEPRVPHRVLHAGLRPARERALPRAGRARSATTGRSASR